MKPETSRRGASKILSGVLILAAICLGSGLGVGILYVQMKDGIEAKQAEVFRETLAVVLGEGSEYEKIGDEATDLAPVYVNRKEGGVVYAAMGSAQGYQSEIRVLVSVKADAPEKPVGEDPVIHRMAVVSSQETPGLGENVNAVAPDVSIWAAVVGKAGQPGRPWFQEQFSGKRLSDLTVVPGPSERNVQALTGATITSRAATEAARRAVQKIIDTTQALYGS